MSIAIKVKDLSKEYIINNAINDVKDNPISLRSLISKSSKKTLNALNDVSFEIQKGECYAILGENGSGKSTLFKILSKITIPTNGSISYKGKVASLLEVGSGLHPDLSARENIYFYGKILGMKKKKIEEKFNDIVAYSEFENFIDVEIKKHSIGMQLRLALSVAIHLDANILLFDEVLSVGDISFQQKIMNTMKSIISKGEKTLLFISHDENLLKEICQKAIVLQKGNLVFDGSYDDAINFYHQLNE